MSLLLWCEVSENLALPDFGDAFREHIARKKHPQVRACSLSAWNLLALALREWGCTQLPRAAFAPGGKPLFADAPLHFSLSHSGNLAAVILSDAPCALDIEAQRADMEERLRLRCMTPEELAANCSFFEAWTKKECIAKLNGRGLPAHPNTINTLDADYAGRFFNHELRDSLDNRYALSALCADADRLRAEKRDLIER